jgi:putative endonuclease
MSQHIPCVYILANRHNSVIYAGVTANLIECVWQHKRKLADDFTRQYQVDRLVWFELHETMYAAVVREKQINEWKRSQKVELIDSFNPDWRDLYAELSA